MNEEITLSSSLGRIKDAVDDLREMTGESGTIEDIVSAVSNLGRVPEVYFVKNKEEMEELNAVLDDLCLVRDNTNNCGATNYIESNFSDYPIMSRRMYFPENITLSSTLPSSIEHLVTIEEFNSGTVGEIALNGENEAYTFSIETYQTEAIIDILYTSTDGCNFHRDHCIIDNQEVYGLIELPYYLSFYNDTTSSILEIHKKCMREYEIKPWTSTTKSSNVYLKVEVSLDEPIVGTHQKYLDFPNGSSALFSLDDTGASITYDNSGFSFEARWSVCSTGYVLQKVSAEGSGLRGYQNINFSYDNHTMNIITDGVVIPFSRDIYFRKDSDLSNNIEPFLKFLGAESNTITDLYKYNGTSWDIISLDE